MFKLRFIQDRSYQKPVKDRISEVFSVELVTVFVKIALKKLFLYAMVHVQKE